jgi:Ca-activated chloride channel homolog
MWTLESPLYLLLLLVLPFAIYIKHYRKGRGGRIAYTFAVWKGNEFLPQSKWLNLLLLAASLSFWAGCILLVFALAGPAKTKREKIFLTKGIDIMIVLDESPSMSAQDFLPDNRFETAKVVIRDFADGRENDAIGLVSFSKEAALRVPPTLNRKVLFDRLKELRIMSLGDGTAIGMGIAIAALHLEKSTAVEKVVVLITDGENNAGEIEPESAAEIAAQLGIRIYAVGIGTEGEVSIEYTDPSTGKLKRGKFNSRFNEELLRELADTSGGRYFSANSPGALDTVLRSIDSLESTERRVKVRINSEPRHQLFILLGIFFIVFEYSIRKGFLREVI